MLELKSGDFKADVALRFLRADFKQISSAAIGVAIAALAPCGIADVVDIANSVRLKGCGESSADIRALRPHARLDEAARRIASGESLEGATSAADYHARVSASIRVPSADGDDDIAQSLAGRFCEIVADPDFREIGVFQRRDRTWMVLAGPFVPSESVDSGELDDRVLELINEARLEPRRCGRKKFPATTPLEIDAALEHAAQAHARDMASRGRLGHEGSDGSMPADRVTRADYAWKAVAENIAAGQTTAEEAVSTWLASPGHCENLMSPRYSQTGIAHAVNRDAAKGIYWAQVFAAPGR